MKCELLAESNYALLLDFIDDVNTKYDETVLKAFLNEKNAYGYIAVDDGKAIGFAYGYVLNEPDGRKTFYLHAIDIMTGYQNLGYGTELVRFVYAHSKSLGWGVRTFSWTIYQSMSTTDQAAMIPRLLRY